METKELLSLVKDELDQRKGENITVLDVIGKTSVTDYMVIVTSTSDRHGKALAGYVLEKVKQFGLTPSGFEGQPGSNWMLLDLGDIIVHIMTQEGRDFYQLEKLWTVDHVEHSAE